MIENRERHHGMTEELAFLSGLGGWGKHRPTPERRLRCLRGYIASLPTRDRWFDGVNVAKLKATALAMIAELE